ncbi:MAG: Lrp/AsnC family transcriptional regulator [Gammaproteobacteria bacterium]|nr:Lrp/AsnC family transcriptional regulator [Gammaproteobacteria bacterium]
MDELRRNFINKFQGDFPLVEYPYASVAAELGCDEVALISMIQQLLDEGVLSRFGPLYDAVNMGGALTLAALSVPDNDFDQVAEQVNALPEVAHNYRRDHEMNMWFVIATETPEGIQKAIDEIEGKSGLHVYNFPKLQEFYLGLWLFLDEQGGVSTRSFSTAKQSADVTLDELDRGIIEVTQSGLPLTPEPFNEIAVQLGSDTATIMSRMQAMLEKGVIRRIGAVPNHYRLGLRGNGMSVWDVPDDRLGVLGEKMGQLEFVSHCYERPRHLPQWPYNLFAMVHGHDRDEVNRKVEQIADMLGSECNRHDVLFSSAILKKTGLRLAA